jgi:hypothetical protein
MRTRKIARFVSKDSIPCRTDMTTKFLSIDPMAEKYFQMSPYAYCANNPILFIDPNGEEIWIYYGENNSQKVRYDNGKLYNSDGSGYNGDDSFVSTSLTYLNEMNSTENGSTVVGGLVSSKNQFNFTNSFVNDDEGNMIPNALAFEGSKAGGGEIHAGALLNAKMQDGQKLEATAHELFHGYQWEKGETLNGSLRTVDNEVGAFLFGRSVYYSYNKENGYGMLNWGNGTQAGNAYENAMSSLIWAPSLNSTQYNVAVNNFKAGSTVNVSKADIPGQGVYKNFRYNRSITNPLIKNFFPLNR